MKQTITLFLFLFFITACSTEDIASKNHDNTHAPEQNAPIRETENPQKKVLTLYIHGYSNDGATEEGYYGVSREESSIKEQIGSFGYTFIDQSSDSNETDHLFSTIKYYGDTPPAYYTQQDIAEVNHVEKGIPRYALIVTKYINYLIAQKGITQVNLMSASMGSLVSRYLIEKDTKGLIANKYIKQWLSFEGVIKGNMASSNEMLYDLTSLFKTLSIDTEHMKYEWINAHLDEDSSKYSALKIGFESSTKDDLNNYALSGWLKTTQGGYKANDGYQVVRDTFFDTYKHTHTLLHSNHLSLSENRAAWASAVMFFHANKHVKITLSEVTLHTLYESKTLINDGVADVVFESHVYSPSAQKKWGIERAIDERLYTSKYPKLHHFEKKDLAYPKEIVLFDGMVLDEEAALKVDIKPIELDLDGDYGVFEAVDKGENESFEKLEFAVPMQEGSYEFNTVDWSGKIKVEFSYERNFDA
jgi:hypothetical protein